MVVRQAILLSLATSVAAQSEIDIATASYLNTTAPSQCWFSDYTAPKCCLHIPNDECWAEPFNEQTCCNVDTIVSSTELDSLKAQISDRSLDLSCGCRPDDAVDWSPTGERNTFWCRTLHTIALGHEFVDSIYELLTVDNDDLAKCPAGAASLALALTYRKSAHAWNEEMLFTSPGYRYASQLFDILFANARLEDILYSGWPLFEQLSYMREQMYLVPENSALYQEVKNRAWYDEISKVLVQDFELIDPIDFEKSMKVYTQVDDENFVKTGETLRARAMAAMAIAEFMWNRTHVQDDMAIAHLEHSQKVILELYEFENISPTTAFTVGFWPMAFFLHRLTLRRVLPIFGQGMLNSIQGTSWDDGTVGKTDLPDIWNTKILDFHHLPYREMSSVNARAFRVPFCGLVPWIVFIESYVNACHEGADRAANNCADRFTFLEGGAHMGDCTLWAAGVFRAAGIDYRGVEDQI